MTDVQPYPFRTSPYMRVKVWGGRTLPEKFDKPAPDDEPIGEAWEVADLEEGESHVATGPASGAPLSELVDDWGKRLIGLDAPDDAFPLLVKVLDAADDLSVQVHPSEEDVRTSFPDAESKDESWLILGAEPEGSILHGVREGVDAEAFRRAVDEGRAAELLRRVNVEPGHVVRVVPGTIHAICKGVTLLEIQQPSDTTYRVYDYDRPGLDGEPRELHLDQAMRVANFGDQPPTELHGTEASFDGAETRILVDVPAYRIERAEVESNIGWPVDPASPQVVFVERGTARLRAPDLPGPRGESFDLTRGQTAVVPAASGRLECTPVGGAATLVVAGLGGHPLLRN